MPSITMSSPLPRYRSGVRTSVAAFVDPFEVLFNLQRALDARLASDWLQDQTTSVGPFPPINVFQQEGDLLAIIELPGIDKNSLQIEAKEDTIRIAGKKAVAYPEEVASTVANASRENSTARFPSRSNWSPTASRRNIATASWHCSCRGLRATNRARSP